MADIDDVITLGGQKFPVTRAVRGNAVSEFESGLKVGSATYDNREHAFFLVLDDWSGGFGHRRLDIRSELGTYWTPVPGSASPDLSRAGRVTLSGAQQQAALTSVTNFNAGWRRPSMPFCKVATGRWILGFGNQLYYSTGLHDAFSVGYTAGTGSTGAGQAQAVIEAIRPNGTPEYYGCFNCYDGSSTSSPRYVRSADGITWENGSSAKCLDDMIWWDNKIIAAWGHQIIFGVTDNTGEAWNIDDANDGQPIATITSGPIHFIGVADAPWGQPSVYFTDERDLYVLDFYNRTAIKIDLGSGTSMWDGCIYQGSPTLTDGYNVVSYSPQGTSRYFGLPLEDGVPPVLRGGDTAGYDFRIQKLIPVGATLFAVAAGYSTPGTAGGNWKTILLKYNGAGWHQVGETISDFANFGYLLSAPPNDVSGFDYPVSHLRYIGIPHLAKAGNISNSATTTTLERFYLPVSSMIYGYGVDNFSGADDSYGNIAGQKWQTGWMDMGFRELDGVLLRMNIDGFNMSASETLKVEYRIDNDETASFTQMVDAAGVVKVFDDTHTALYFVNAIAPVQGAEFRTVQFQFTLNRGTDQTKTPEIKALTLVYNKKAPFRGTYKLTIDCNRMLERSTTQGDTTFYIDGQPATMTGIWQKLRDFWDTQTLLPLVVPSLEPTGVAVILSDIPITIDDFRAVVGGKGTLDITVLEAINSRGIQGAGSDGTPAGGDFTIATHAAFNFPLFNPQVTLYSATGLEYDVVAAVDVNPTYNMSRSGYVGTTWDDHFLILVTVASDPEDQRLLFCSNAGIVGTDVSLLIDANDTGYPLCVEADTAGNIYVVWKRDNTQALQLRKYDSGGTYVSALDFGAGITTEGYGAWLAAGPSHAVYVMQNTNPYTIYQFDGAAMTLTATTAINWTPGPGLDIDEDGYIYTSRYTMSGAEIAAAFIDRRDSGLTIQATLTMDDVAAIADFAYGDSIVFVDYRSKIVQYTKV